MAHNRGTMAFTRRDLVALMAVLVVLVTAFLVPKVQEASKKAQRISCICNLKQLGTAYRIFANDNGNLFPAFLPLTNGGWSNLLYRSNAGIYTYTNYALMANEIGQSPRVLHCPSDERKHALSFSNSFSNDNISYFVGVTPNDEANPQAFLGGDRNLGPGTTPDPDYGYSPADGSGNDVFVNGPVCWSLKMHSRGNDAGAGNIMLADGSAQQVTSESLRHNWLTNSFVETRAEGKTTSSIGIRLIFP